MSVADQQSTSVETSTKSQTSSATPGYSPAPGDVVSFEYEYSITDKPATGLIFTSGSSIWVWHNGEGDVLSGNVTDPGKKNFRKIGTSAIGPITTRDEAEAIAKAYFTSAKEQVGFKGSEVVWIRERCECKGTENRIGLRYDGNLTWIDTEMSVTYRNRPLSPSVYSVIGTSDIDTSSPSRKQLVALYDEYDVETGEKKV